MILNSVPEELPGRVIPEHGAALACRVHTGTIGINHYIPDPAAPFGGVKNSGLGRELGPEGLASYQETQTIYL